MRKRHWSWKNYAIWATWLNAMHHFFVLTSDFRQQQVFFSKEQSHQLCQVLRMQPGQSVVVFDETAVEYLVTLTHITPQQVIGAIQSQRPSLNEPTTQITLFQSLLKRDKFEWVLQKGTEIGVTGFVPIVTQRSLVQDTRMKSNKLTRWQKIIIEASEQAHRSRIPQLATPKSWPAALELVNEFDLVLVAHVSGKRPLQTILTTQLQQPKSIALFIGPEGGFSDNEVAQAQTAGAHIFAFGPRVLRTETAATVATALILYELGDML